MTKITQRRRIWRTFLKNKTAAVGSVVALIAIFAAIFAPWISPYDPLEQDVFYRLTPPENIHPLGTDRYGRDVLSRVIWGARISLLVGTLSVLFGMVVGTSFGMIAAYKGGKIESVIMRATDILMSFPDEVLGIMVMVVLGSGLFNLIGAIGILLAPRFVRLAYGPTLALREKEYVDAARAIGMSDSRIITKHVLPNIFGEILVMGTLWMGLAIRLEANLSFLGLGVSPPTPTWGNMIRTGVAHLTNAPWLSVFPGLAILITVLSFNMMGDGLRDVTDPKLRA
jgi:peptide/nickel transport system permease protein